MDSNYDRKLESDFQDDLKLEYRLVTHQPILDHHTYLNYNLEDYWYLDYQTYLIEIFLVYFCQSIKTYYQKTSLFLKVSNLKVSFKGSDISNFSQEQMRQIRGDTITMIFQEPLTSLNPLHKIGSQIIEVLQEHNQISKSEAKKKALELLKEVQIPQPEERLNQYPHQLSGGQRQRIMIAMAIANRPDLLIADEPTTALDVTIQSQILKLLKELQKKYGMAIMLITHDLTVVRKTSDRICVMRYGKIVERGNTEEVFKNPQHASVAAFFSEHNCIDGHIYYAHQIRLTSNGPFKARVVKSFFRGRCFMIEAAYKDNVIFFEHSDSLISGAEVFLSFS
mgnify:CR=1 FL=1